MYIHTNKTNGKKYIGMTCDIEKRFGKDGSGYLHKNNKGEYIQPYFARAILKHGWDNFTHEIIKSDLTLEEANQLEDDLIKKYDTQNIEKGYNIRNGGSHGVLSEETKQKLSDTMMGRYDGDKNPFFGKTHSEETIKKMRQNASKLAASYSKEELSEKMRKTALGCYYLCVETGVYYRDAKEAAKAVGVSRNSISGAANGYRKTSGGYHWKKFPKETRKGYKDDITSEEIKEIILASSIKEESAVPEKKKSRKKTEEQKEHMRKIMTGRVMTEEHKRNIGKAHAPYEYVCIETGEKYYSAGEAERQTGIAKASIQRAANGQQMTAGGYHWKKNLKKNS